VVNDDFDDLDVMQRRVSLRWGKNRSKKVYDERYGERLGGNVSGATKPYKENTQRIARDAELKGEDGVSRSATETKDSLGDEVSVRSVAFILAHVSDCPSLTILL
jgi:hypothetical protein